MNIKLSIFFVHLKILLFILCILIDATRGGEGVENDASYSISSVDFDPQQQRLHPIIVSNEIAAPFSSSETRLFFLAADELHGINNASSLVKLGRLVDFRYAKKQLDFVQTKAAKWKNQVIFVADVGHSYYVYAVALTPSGERESNTTIIAPIQKLTKHGQAQTITFFHFEDDLYCLLGSTVDAERRSELRFLKWSRSYFQVIETIMNHNHRIDLVTVSPRHNLILIVHNKVEEDDDTAIQVHRYQAVDNSDSKLKERELITERVQDIFVPYELSAANMFFYSDTGALRLYLITCDGPVLTAIPNDLCQFYTWKRDGIAESTRFQRLQRFPLSEAITNVAKDGSSTLDGSIVLNLDSLLAIQSGDAMHTFNGEADRRTVNVSRANLIGNSLERRLTSDSKSIVHNLINIYQEPDMSNGMINIDVRTWELFEEKVPDTTLGSPGVAKPGRIPSGDIASELSRIKELLIDLRSHLISENEQYLKPMQDKITSMKEALRMREVLKSGTFGPEPLTIYCSELKITAPINETKIGVITLNADRNNMDAKLADTYERLKKVNIGPSVRSKRSVDVRETIHVRRLTIQSENHPFQGMLRRNATDNTYQLDGKIKTHTLRLNHVYGNGTATTPPENMVGGVANFYRRIQVKSINGANWDDFVASLYRRGRNTPINGDVILTYPTSIRSLYTDELNGVPPKDYLTIATDQQIDSIISIPGIHVSDIQSSVINNMPRFAEFVALIGRDNIVDTRVKISIANISNSLQLSDKEGEELTQHIVGTRMEDLSQIYNGRIVIKGSLSLQNVQLLDANDASSPFAPIAFDPSSEPRPAAQIVIDGTPFELRSIPQQYWMKSRDQNFADVTFTQPITVPQLNADFLQSHPTEDYFVLGETNESPNQFKSMSVIFEGETVVAGNLETADPSETSLSKLSTNAVRRGAQSTVSKPVTFSGHLVVDNVGMVFDTNQFVHRDRTNSQSDDALFDKSVRKTFAGTVFIANDLNVVNNQSVDITIDRYNDYQSLHNRLGAMVLIDRPQSLDSTLIFDGHLFSDNFTVSVFIDHADYDKNSGYDYPIDVNVLLGEIFNLRENQIENLNINGHVRFANSDQLTINTFNGIPLSNYFPLVVLQQHSGDAIPIYGTKTFAGDMTVQSMSVSSIDRQIYVDDWKGSSLRSQSTPGATQVIDGSDWVIGTLRADNVEIRGTINGLRMPIKNHPAEASDVIIVDDPFSDINIWSTLLFAQGLHIGDFAELTSDRIANCNVNELFTNNRITLSQKYWNSVRILGSTSIPPPAATATASKTVSEFFRDAVVTDTDQVIGGSGKNITIKTNGRVIFDEIRTDAPVKSQQPLINGVNLIDFYTDAITTTIVSVDGDTQPILIEGKKEFLNKYVELTGPQTICEENLNAKRVQDVDIVALNESLIRRGNENLEIKDGRKWVFMKSPKVERLIIDADSTINGVSIDDIFFIYDKVTRTPHIEFAERNDYGSCVHVLNSLQLDNVNDLSLKYFLENRVRKYIGNSVATADNSDLQLVSGHLTIENVEVSGAQTKIDAINDILCDDVVIPGNDGEPQHISGFKEITGELYVHQPMSVIKINGIEVLGTYAKTVFLDQNQTLETLSVREPYRVDTRGLNVLHKINGIALPADLDHYSVVGARSRTADDDDDEFVVAAKASKPTKVPIKRFNYIDVTKDIAVTFNAKNAFDASNANDIHRNWLTIDSFYGETVHRAGGLHESVSMCPVQYHVQFKGRTSSRQQQLEVRRAAIGERLHTLTLNTNYIVHIHTVYPPAINYYENCHFELHRKRDEPLISRVLINYKQQLQFPGEYIENAHIFQVPQTRRVYLVLHSFNSSVQIMRSSLDDGQQWSKVQTIPLDKTQIPSMIFNVKLIEWQRRRVLIIAQSSPSSVRYPKTGNKHLRLFRFNEANEKFEPSTIIEGDFNIISSILIDQQAVRPGASVSTYGSELHMVLAKQGSRTAQFWKADDHVPNDINFRFVREQTFDGGIESLSTFAENGVTFLSVILNDGQFHIYQYRARENFKEMFSPVWINMAASSWQKKMIGHFGHGKVMVPFTFNAKLYLFVFMNENTAKKENSRSDANQIAKVYTLYYY